MILVGCGKDSSGTIEGKYVTLGDYKKISVKVEKGTVSDASVKSYMQKLLDYYAPEGMTVTVETATDDFVKEYVEGYDTVKGLEEAVRKQLNETNDYYAENNTRTAVVEKLNEICTVKEMPKGLLEERVASYEKLFKEKCKSQYGVEFEEYLKNYGMTEDSFHEQTVKSMEESLKTELILQEIANQEKIEIDKKGYSEFIEQMMKNYGYEKEDKLYEDYGKEYMEDSYLCNKAIELVVEKAEVEFVAPGVTLD